MARVSTTTVIALEGVLAGRPEELVDLTQTPLEATGFGLYVALGTTSKLVLATNLDRRLVAHWCRVNGLTAHSTTISLDERAVIQLRANGENVGLYVDSDAERAATALRNGVPTLLFTRPLFARAGFRPDLPQLQKPWAQLVAESKAQRAARVSPLATAGDDS